MFVPHLDTFLCNASENLIKNNLKSMRWIWYTNRCPLGPTQSTRPPNQNLLSPSELISCLFAFKTKSAQNRANLLKTFKSCSILENWLYTL